MAVNPAYTTSYLQPIISTSQHIVLATKIKSGILAVTFAMCAAGEVEGLLKKMGYTKDQVFKF